MQFNPVDPGFVATFRSIDIILNKTFYFGIGHFLGILPGQHALDATGRDGRPPADGHVISLATGMMKLNKDRSIIKMNGFAQLGKPWDAVVGGGRGLAGHHHAGFIIYPGNLANNQPDPAFGALGIVGAFAFRNRRIVMAVPEPMAPITTRFLIFNEPILMGDNKFSKVIEILLKFYKSIY